MPSILNVVINDGAATPVARTFEAYLGQNGALEPATWLEKTNPMFLGYKKITLLVTRSNGSAGATKVTGKIEDPRTVTSALGVVTIQHRALFSFSFVLPDTMSSADRDDILAYAKNFFAHSSVTAAVKQMSPTT